MKLASFAIPIALLLAPAASAEELRPWLSGALTYAGYDMGDPNREFEELNTLFAPGSPKLGPIERAVGFSLAGGIDFPSRFSVGAGYQRLPAWTEGGDPDARFEYNLAGNAFFASVGWRAPLSGTVDFGLDLDAGLVSTSGKISTAIAGLGSGSGDISGNGPYLAGGAHLDWWAHPLLALSLRAGWRRAESDGLRVEDRPVTNLDGSEYTVDYGGVALGLGLKAVLPR